MNNVTYYRIGKMLDITQSNISKYKNGTRFFDDETAIKVAELLGVNPEIVLADIHAERAKIRKTKEVWQGIAKALRATAAAVLVSAILVLDNSNTSLLSGTYAEQVPNNLYYVKLYIDKCLYL